MRKLSKLVLAASVALGVATMGMTAAAHAETLVRIATPYPATTLDPSRSAAASPSASPTVSAPPKTCGRRR